MAMVSPMGPLLHPWPGVRANPCVQESLYRSKLSGCDWFTKRVFLTGEYSCAGSSYSEVILSHLYSWWQWNECEDAHIAH